MQTYKVIVDSNKNIRWFNDKDQFHRLDGPAIEGVDGYKAWLVEGKYHRLDGPAREWANGDKVWWVENKLHRLDGPAVENADGYKAWYVEGKYMTEKEFNAYIKPKPACEGKIVEVDGVKYKLIKANNVMTDIEFKALVDKLFKKHATELGGESWDHWGKGEYGLDNYNAIGFAKELRDILQKK